MSLNYVGRAYVKKANKGKKMKTPPVTGEEAEVEGSQTHTPGRFNPTDLTLQWSRRPQDARSSPLLQSWLLQANSPAPPKPASPCPVPPAHRIRAWPRRRA